MAGVTSGGNVTLEASDGFELSAWRVEPRGEPRGGVVVLQEIFGVNDHIRSVAATFARAGYLAIAPALYDRVAPGSALGYGEADIRKGMELRAASRIEDVMADVQAAVDAAGEAGRVGSVGYCWGGQLSWRAAHGADNLSAAVVYYGGGVGDLGDLAPRRPVLGHFATQDAHIPVEGVLNLQARYPDQVSIELYDADHGFNCEARASYQAESAELALQRTLAFFDRNLARQA